MGQIPERILLLTTIMQISVTLAKKGRRGGKSFKCAIDFIKRACMQTVFTSAKKVGPLARRKTKL